MKVIVVYPIPNETPEVWEQFKPFVQRFVETFNKYPPGIDCHVAAINFGDYGIPEMRELLNQLPSGAMYGYDGAGMDIGSAQWLAHNWVKDAFMCMMTTRCYFHRAGWLEKILEARLRYGPGLYGVSASYEGGNLHICTRAYSMDAADFRAYPVEITSRDQGCFFEVGMDNPHGSLSDLFLSQGKQARVVNWDSCVPVGDFFTVKNCFRDGDQSNMLVWDKHSDIYRDATPEHKEHLAQLAFGLAPPAFSA